ncbi:MAG: RNB domain-containing ribonuclease [Sphingobium sp.]|nr:RNB domain-containing ribonuclease [Sphingobium sp.]
MKTIIDTALALGPGLAEIRASYQVPADFPPDVLAEAEQAARRAPAEHVDRTDMPFVTLDPATSTDLDQAFAIDRVGGDILLHYAIADVAWFVADDGPMDREAWARGGTIYLPDGKARLYPAAISEAAASLLPDGPRPAIIFTVRVAPDGTPTLEGAERAVIRSRAKLAYDSVRTSDLPPDFDELAARIAQAEDARGASRVDPPEQEVSADGQGGFTLRYRPRLPSEDRNAALSLATNLAIGQALLAHRTGLFRVMAEPDAQAIARLRFTARAFGLDWPAHATLAQFERSLRADVPAQAAFMLAIRRAGNGASYEPWREGVTPWHSAVGATYAQATAPLRRLADRYVVQAVLAIANGRAVPDPVTQAFEKLPPVMARADQRSGQIERAVIDLAECLMLRGHEGARFPAIVTDLDERGARIQLRDLPVVTRIASNGHRPGAAIDVMLTSIDPVRRLIAMEASG